MRIHRYISAVAVFVVMGSAALAANGGKAVFTPNADIKWTDAGIPGVTIANVEGDRDKGASHFYLKYPHGFVSPAHHHSSDHYVTLVSGTLVLIVDGAEHRLTPGSFFSITGKAKHIARCEGSEDCVMSIDARGKWDVVPEEKK